MSNEENIIPYRFTSEQDREKAAAAGRKGGVASGKVRRERRALRESLELVAAKPLKGGKKPTDLAKLKDLSKETIKGTNLTAGDALAITLFQQALGGNIHAYEIIRDQLGEKPVEEHKVAVVIDEDKALEEWIKKIKEDKNLKEGLRDGD